MKISKNRLKKIILEEQKRLLEDKEEEHAKHQKEQAELGKLARFSHILLGKSMEKFDDYYGSLSAEEEPPKECTDLHDDIHKIWFKLDKFLTGGEDPDKIDWLRHPSEGEKKDFDHDKLQENQLIESQQRNFDTVKDWMTRSKPHPKHDEALYREWQSAMLALGDLKPMSLPGGWRPGEDKEIKPGEAPRPKSWEAPKTKVRFAEQEGEENE
jgi:hypothetical protein